MSKATKRGWEYVLTLFLVIVVFSILIDLIAACIWLGIIVAPWLGIGAGVLLVFTLVWVMGFISEA